MNNKITFATKEIPLADGTAYRRTVYRVGGKVCAFMDRGRGRISVHVGKPSDRETLSFTWPDSPEGEKKALAKTTLICQGAMQWNAIITGAINRNAS